jgi:hypothetical protein
VKTLSRILLGLSCITEALCVVAMLAVPSPQLFGTCFLLFGVPTLVLLALAWLVRPANATPGPDSRPSPALELDMRALLVKMDFPISSPDYLTAGELDAGRALARATLAAFNEAVPGDGKRSVDSPRPRVYLQRFKRPKE